MAFRWGTSRNKLTLVLVGLAIRLQVRTENDDHAKSTMEDPLVRIEMKRQPLTEPQSSEVSDDQNSQLLLQMAMLCANL